MSEMSGYVRAALLQDLRDQEMNLPWDRRERELGARMADEAATRIGERITAIADLRAALGLGADEVPAEWEAEP